MNKMGLKEDDFGDTALEEEEPLSAEATRWLAVPRVHNSTEYSQL